VCVQNEEKSEGKKRSNPSIGNSRKFTLQHPSGISNKTGRGLVGRNVTRRCWRGKLDVIQSGLIRSARNEMRSKRIWEDQRWWRVSPQPGQDLFVKKTMSSNRLVLTKSVSKLWQQKLRGDFSAKIEQKLQEDMWKKVNKINTHLFSV